jgi:hypothetical protein
LAREVYDFGAASEKIIPVFKSPSFVGINGADAVCAEIAYLQTPSLQSGLHISRRADPQVL